MEPTPNPVPIAPQPQAATGFPAIWRSPAVLPAVILMATGIMVGSESVVALAIVLLEGAVSLGALAAAALAGMWLLPLLGLGREVWRDRLVLGAGLGIGSLSLLVLGLGTLGWLQPGATVLIAVMAVAGLARITLDIQRALVARSVGQPNQPPSTESPADVVAAERSRREALALAGYHYLWLLAAPFLAVTMLAVTLPPGILWSEEAWSYDVLEYHLAVPKEFFEAGHIFFMPYNAYSNFPMNSEMLSLLVMNLRGETVEAALAAQIVNLGLAVVFVLGAWWTGRLYSRFAGVTAGVLAATTPWLGYLAGIAYVEPGMLAMGMIALGAMLRAAREEKAAGRWALTAGLLAGFACGYKYTALPLITAPIALIPLFAAGGWTGRFKQIALFVIACIATFSPWLIRNQINTGNPVFPLAYSVFGAKPGVWDDELQARWQRGHGWSGAALNPGESFIRVAVERTVLEPRVGIVLLLFAAAGIFAHRDRWTLALLLLLVVQVAVWFTATHLFARFAVVLVIPLVVLAGRVVENVRSRVTTSFVALVLTAGAVLNIYHFAGLYYLHTRIGADAKPMQAHGHVNWFAKGEWPGLDYLKILNVLEKSPRVMFVGEARTFYVAPPRDYAVAFSRHPLAEAVERLIVVKPAVRGPAGWVSSAAPIDILPVSETAGADAGASGSVAVADAAEAPPRKNYAPVLKWLRDRGVTHLLVHWLELERLHRTYGLDPALTPELFVELESAGLLRIGDFMLEDNGMTYATLYEVPHE